MLASESGNHGWGARLRHSRKLVLISVPAADSYRQLMMYKYLDALISSNTEMRCGQRDIKLSLVDGYLDQGFSQSSRLSQWTSTVRMLGKLLPSKHAPMIQKDVPLYAKDVFPHQDSGSNGDMKSSADANSDKITSINLAKDDQWSLSE